MGRVNVPTDGNTNGWQLYTQLITMVTRDIIRELRGDEGSHTPAGKPPPWLDLTIAAID